MMTSKPFILMKVLGCLYTS